ncbi:putative disease resistance protein RGA1 [Camellia lanceoleosa]|uniref:Disease resistance protein RGA1 n=1 Tax=Camellia lanceoleosa TaxID=1840588 RepID=A0ACC0G696_9ERIC|nr:putative disease resistance protein RGA1 [Camellia lanceoleosa]
MTNGLAMVVRPEAGSDEVAVENGANYELDLERDTVGSEDDIPLPEEVLAWVLSRINENVAVSFNPYPDDSRSSKAIPYCRGIKPSDAASKIKKAYRKAALRHHPDKAGQFVVRSENGDDGQLWKEIPHEVHKDADRLFKMIREAYARSQYDLHEELRNAQKESNGSRASRGPSDDYSSPFDGSANRQYWKQSWKTWELAFSILRSCRKETIVFNIASKVLGSLGSLAINEVGLGWGLDEELKTLEGTLSTIKEVLSYADEKQGKNHVVKIWYERLQATFYEADNLLDEFQYEALRRQVQSMKLNHHHHSRSSIRIQKLHGNLSNTCRMPGIIRDLAVYMANEECVSTANYRFGPISKTVSHVSFHDSDCSGEKELTKSLFKLEKMRTVLFPFHAVEASDEGFVDECISRFKYLRVFDLRNSSFRKLPHSVGNLKHLRFLDLSGNANIETLPNAICKLYNLQTLQIEYCVKIRELLKNIGNLISLRHLYLTTQQSCLPERQIRRLTSLQSFRIIGCGNLTSLPEGMQLLTALTTVTITACPKLTSLPSTMKNLANLRNPEISNCPNLSLAGWEEFRGLRRLQ